MRILAISALALATVATPAFAQEEGSFSGGHIALIAGLDHVSDGVDDENGGVIGIAVGGDFDLGGIVGGVEAEADLPRTKRCIGAACVESGRDLYAGVRLGVPVAPRTMVYVKGGYTNAQIKGTLNGTTVTSDEFDGVRVGAGVQTVVQGNFLIKVEYRYSNYEQDVSRHQGVVGVGFAF